MMTMARAGIGMAIAGGIALAVHGMLLAKPARHPSDRALYDMLLVRQAQLRSDRAAWIAAEDAIEADMPCPLKWFDPVHDRWVVTKALSDPDMEWLSRAPHSLVCTPELRLLLLPALRDPSFVGLENAGDISVEGRNMPLHDHGTIVRDDLFTRAGRASWLLKKLTGHHGPIVGVHTDGRQLVDIYNEWQFWLFAEARD